MKAAPATLSPWFSMAQGSRLKPLLPMPRGDQRHSLAVLRTLLEWGETHPALLQAALLHDVGKAAAPLSPWERALLVLTEALCPALLATDPPAAPVAPPLGRAGPAVSGPSEDRGGLGSGGRVRPPSRWR